MGLEQVYPGLCNPGVSIYNVEDLLSMNLGNMIQSIVLMQHTTDQINQVMILIPSNLTPAPDTMKIHEVNVTPCGTLYLNLLSSQSNSKNFSVLRTNKATNLCAKHKSILSLSLKIIVTVPGSNNSMSDYYP